MPRQGWPQFVENLSLASSSAGDVPCAFKVVFWREIVENPWFADELTRATGSCARGALHFFGRVDKNPITMSDRARWQDVPKNLLTAARTE
jgi:hypothetical protein